MKKRIVHHSKTVGYSGTDRTAQLMCKYLAQDPNYEPFLVYREDGENSRLDVMKNILGEDHVVPYHWKPGKRGRLAPYMPEEDNLYEVLEKINPDIVHVHRSGYQEWPMKYLAPKAKWIETNIFGFADKSKDIDKHIYISDFIRLSAINAGNPDGPILYNPIELPDRSREYDSSIGPWRQRLGIRNNAILLGRVGRADNFDPISLRAFAQLEKNNPNVFYLVVNGCGNWRAESATLGLRNIRFLDAIINDTELSEFYQQLDIYAHARSDGECCPCNIQEAMIHGLPVVSHRSPLYNGQSEIIGDTGFVAPINDWQAYHAILQELVSNTVLRLEFGAKAKARAENLFEASKVVEQLKEIYES